MTTLVDVHRAALRALRPPPKVALSAWIESTVHLPQGQATPGPMKLWSFQRQIADSIGDASVERVTVLKSARVGYSSLLAGVIAHHVANDPAQILMILPVESDCRDAMVSSLEPLFDASPALRGLLRPPTRRPDERSTILHRLYPGGSLKLVASKAPRNLRAHSARILLLDEVDAMQPTHEGDPVALAEKRTLSFRDRKIVAGSTPIDESTSHIVRLYNDSDQRIYECPCPACGAFAEIQWTHIEWPPDKPAEATFRCPSCHELVAEANKPAMVKKGRWRPLRPEIEGHAGFRLNALISPLDNASWGKLAQEFLAAKNDPDLLKVFATTILAEPWRDPEEGVEENDLAARVEPFDLERIPGEVLALSCGVDVQDDRFEATTLGWNKAGVAYVLDHRQLWGAPPNADDESWRDLDAFLRSRFVHPNGGTLRIDAACVDAGDGGVYDVTMKFCASRLNRKILAVKGVPGFGRPMLQASKSKRAGGRLFLAGVDAIKASLFAKLARGQAIRFSDSLNAEFFTQLAAEVKRVRDSRGKPVMRFERKPGARAEALDATTYAICARQALSINLDERAAELRQLTPPAGAPSVYRSEWMSR